MGWKAGFLLLYIYTSVVCCQKHLHFEPSCSMSMNCKQLQEMCDPFGWSGSFHTLTVATASNFRATMKLSGLPRGDTISVH